MPLNTQAYMFVYIRADQQNEILNKKEEIPPALVTQFQNEQKLVD